MVRLGIEGSGPGFYRLDNLGSGTVLRGKTDPRGGLPDLILPPNQNFRLTRVDARTLAVSVSEFGSAATGFRTLIPRGAWLRDSTGIPDTDADGLDDLAESTLGTNPARGDTDGDGVSDAAEITAGTDPLGGVTLATGIIGSADTPGNAADVCVTGNLAAVADGTAGVTLFDVSRPQQPVAVARIDTPGRAVAVACDIGRVHVADAQGGLGLIDTRNPAAATLARSTGLGGDAVAVAVWNGFVAVGLANGRVLLVDPATGRVTASIQLDSAVSDLQADVSGYLWVATRSRLVTLALRGLAAALDPVGSVPLAFFPEGITGRRRLALGESRAYITSYPGFEVFDISSPAAAVRIGDAIDRGPNSFKQIVPASPVLGLAAVGINPRPDGTHDVSLYDLATPSQTTNFLAEFPTPGIAHALALHRGRALVADGDSGLQILNPIPADTGATPPSIRLITPASTGEVEEGSTILLRAEVADDVFVRNVEFHVDGELFTDDGAYPFATSYVAPLLSAGANTLVLRARAFDTGGNAAWSQELTLRIVRDHTPPEVVFVSPPDTSVVGETRTVTAVFQELLLPESLAGSLRVWPLPAGQTAVGDALPPTDPVDGTLGLAGNSVVFQVTDPLPPGRYLAQIEPSLRDRAGNLLPAPYRWQFVTAAFVDADADGVPDDLEPLLGLSPGTVDSNGDGVPDGAEDFDRDGVPNAWERLAGFDPRNPRSVDPLRLDGMVDRDFDGLADWRETEQGTEPAIPDTDGDGWPDGPEVELGTQPLDARSRPNLALTLGAPTVLRPGPSDPLRGGGRIPVVVAAPLILRPGLSAEDGFGALPITPSVAPIVLRPGTGAEGAFSGLPFALPPVSIRIAVP